MVDKEYATVGGHLQVENARMQEPEEGTVRTEVDVIEAFFGGNSEILDFPKMEIGKIRPL